MKQGESIHYLIGITLTIFVVLLMVTRLGPLEVSSQTPLPTPTAPAFTPVPPTPTPPQTPMPTPTPTPTNVPPLVGVIQLLLL